ncbi:MAG: TonB family protein [Blastocatellia bacterium]|nr:TonB family protein [Blastocatellia bacterium]
MKRPALFLILIICLSCPTYGQARGEEKKRYLAGPVQTIGIEKAFFSARSGNLREGSRNRYMDYSYDEAGNLIESISYFDGGKPRREVFNYNEEGNLVESLSYESKDSLVEKQTHTYNAEGDETEHLRYDEKGELTSKTVYRHDSERRLVEKLFYKDEEPNGKEAFAYDENGRTIERITYDGKGDMTGKTVTGYDDEANRIERSKYGPKGEFEGKTVTTYDPKGNVIAIDYYRADGGQAWKLEFVYDDKENVIEEKFANRDNLNMWAYEYEYDSMGNWTKKTTSRFFSVQGKVKPFPSHAIYRSFKYYSKPNAIKPIADPEIGGVLQGEAISRVQPSYPQEARAIRMRGMIVVEVTVDTEGNVESARAISGNVFFHHESEKAARQWKFRPTLLNGVPVKVIGTITFNFM